VKVQGLDKLRKKLQRLEKKAAKRAVRKAIRAGTTIVAKAVKREAPVDEGLLKAAQTSKVSAKGNRAAGVIGADQKRLDAETSYSGRPSNINWLVEFGHVAPDGTVIPPSGYHRRAEAASLPRAAQAITAKLAEEIEREASR
jgi:HK97 gp10 family phage protein